MERRGIAASRIAVPGVLLDTDYRDCDRGLFLAGLVEGPRDKPPQVAADMPQQIVVAEERLHDLFFFGDEPLLFSIDQILAFGHQFPGAGIRHDDVVKSDGP